MNPLECRSRFSAAATASLATVGAPGPHLVPVVFALSGDRLVTAVDHKPKRTRRLQRLANISVESSVCLLVNHYDDDWTQLWWVRADGVARVIEDRAEMQPAIDLLVAKYEQYQVMRPQGPVIEVAIEKWSGWSARPVESESLDGNGK